MKKYFFTLVSALFLSLNTYGQLFKASDVAKIADYVVSELQLNGTSAQNVKSLYADYGEKMRLVSSSLEGLPAKQNKIQALTNEMDAKVKEGLPANKKADYDIVTEHYRKKGIGTSALGNKEIASNQAEKNSKAQEVQSNLNQAQEIAENLKQEFKNQLGVNDSQADQLVKITIEHNLQKKIINQTLKADPQARASKMNELNGKTNAKVKGILNDQQFKKYIMILIQSERQ
ncbi:MAG: hypothetical protein LC105_01660 [Chitinophagales bacterium]|nr:hypothetical protein [Chitinophagales bacterium]MCZ2392554.1 hypothetical protein [Chitinophagales bacterium]